MSKHLNPEIKKIEVTKAFEFYEHNIDPLDQVTFLPKGNFYGFFDNNELIGIVSTLKIGSTLRVKTLLTHSKYRKLGVGGQLLKFVLDDKIKMTAFATPFSFNLFKKCGFVPGSETKKNGVTFVVREPR